MSKCSDKCVCLESIPIDLIRCLKDEELLTFKHFLEVGEIVTEWDLEMFKKAVGIQRKIQYYKKIDEDKNRKPKKEKITYDSNPDLVVDRE